ARDRDAGGRRGHAGASRAHRRSRVPRGSARGAEPAGGPRGGVPRPGCGAGEGNRSCADPRGSRPLRGRGARAPRDRLGRRRGRGRPRPRRRGTPPGPRGCRDHRHGGVSMSLPRVLVIRSGARPFGTVAGAEVMEYVSHTIEPVATEPADWAGGFDTVIVTSQTAVERIARDAAHTEAFRSVLESASLIAVGEATAELLRLHGY